MNYQYLVKGGVDRWNQWRKDHPDLYPNLSGANLSHHYLFEVNLSGLSLKGIDLSRACLIGADLSWADLSDANLMGAYLSQADLSSANLHNANLLDASFDRANLRHVNLSNIRMTAQPTNAVPQANLIRKPQRIIPTAFSAPPSTVTDPYSDPHSNISQPLVCFVAAPHFSSSIKTPKRVQHTENPPPTSPEG